ncbi:MAG: hypothetical protein ACRDXC_10455 [Acidimicrobiales bacterium]
MEFSPSPRIPSAFKALALGAAAMAVSGAFATVAAAGTPSTSSVIKSAKAAMAKQLGARVVSVASSKSSSTKERDTTDFGISTGEETISAGDADLSIRVTSTDAYVSGSSSGLTTIFGVTATDAKKIGNDWVFWKAGTSQYSDLEKGVIVRSLTSVLPKVKGTRRSTHTTHGAKLYALKWTSAATSSQPKLSITLTVSARSHLPVALTSTSSAGTKETTTFSHWGEHTVVSAPLAGSTMPSSKIAS